MYERDHDAYTRLDEFCNWNQASHAAGVSSAIDNKVRDETCPPSDHTVHGVAEKYSCIDSRNACSYMHAKTKTKGATILVLRVELLRLPRMMEVL